MSVKNVTEETFEKEILNSEKTTIVDFYADWCGPCKVMSPIIDEIAKDENLNVGKVNVDQNGELAVKYDIMSIPTILVFKNGQLVNRVVGVHDKNEILRLL